MRNLENLEAADLSRWYDGRRKMIEVLNAEGTRVPMHHVGAGRGAFLCCSGPSLATVDLSRLQIRGIVTMGLNNSPAVFAAQNLPLPDYWTCVDAPGHFVEQVWKDAHVTKFIPLGHLGQHIKTRSVATGALNQSAFRVEDCPNVLFYNRNARFETEHWITQTSFNWGNTEGVKDELGHTGSRSVMLVAIKLLYYLGFKRIYLLGADFKMVNGAQNYAFPQDRTLGSINSNNTTYHILNARFAALLPTFKAAGLEIFNCTPESHLQCFDTLSLEEAISQASKEVTEKPVMTLGHYDQPKK